MKFYTALAILLAMTISSKASFAVQEAPPKEAPPIQENENETVVQDPDEIPEANVFEGQAIGVEEQFLANLKQLSMGELNAVSSALELDDNWVESITRQIEDKLTATANDLANQSEPMGMPFGPSITPELREFMWEKIGESLPPEKMEGFKKHQATVLELQKLRNKISIHGILVYLDNELCLSLDQIEQLEKQASKDWNSNNNAQAMMMGINGTMMGRTLIDQIVDVEVVKEVLTPQQVDVYESLSQATNLFVQIQLAAFGQGNDALDPENIKAMCDQAMDLKLAEYDSLVGISEKQRKLLSIARKGVTGKVAAKFEDVKNKMEEDPNLINNINIEVIGIFLEPMVSHCTKKKIWLKTLPKVFDKDQMQKINERESIRKEYVLNQFLHSIVLTLTETQCQLGLNIEQHNRFVDEFRKSMDDDSSSNYISISMSIFKIPNESFQAILTDKQWQTFEPILEQQRTMMEEQMGNTDDNEADDTPDDQ